MSWFKDYTQKWLDEEISTYQYENKINLLVENNVPNIESVKEDSIPNWMSISAQKWLNDEISNEEYFEIIKYVSNSS